jgi:hypothetical protein
MNDLTDFPYNSNVKFVSLDVTNMYSNVPIKEMKATLNKLCELNKVEDKTKQDILKITRGIVQQNYFCLQDTVYVQNESLAMGAPTSSIFSELYLQFTENTKIVELLLKHKVEGYFRYVDDILMMYKEERTDTHSAFTKF